MFQFQYLYYVVWCMFSCISMSVSQNILNSYSETLNISQWKLFMFVLQNESGNIKEE